MAADLGYGVMLSNVIRLGQVPANQEGLDNYYISRYITSSSCRTQSKTHTPDKAGHIVLDAEACFEVFGYNLQIDIEIHTHSSSDCNRSECHPQDLVHAGFRLA